MRILVRTIPAIAAPPPSLTTSRIVVRTRPQRVLDFDVECRPLSFLGADYMTKEITAMAWAWSDRPDDVTVYLLGETELPDMLQKFVEAYDHADLVTGHYIRGFDLPLINGALTEFQLPMLGEKLSHDTKIDAGRRHGMSSSQESWGAMLGLEHDKEQMDQAKWRKANRLKPEGLIEVRRRVVGDVKQHIELRNRMLALGYLGNPVTWRSGSTEAAPVYTP